MSHSILPTICVTEWRLAKLLPTVTVTDLCLSPSPDWMGTPTDSLCEPLNPANHLWHWIETGWRLPLIHSNRGRLPVTASVTCSGMPTLSRWMWLPTHSLCDLPRPAYTLTLDGESGTPTHSLCDLPRPAYPLTLDGYANHILCYRLVLVTLSPLDGDSNLQPLSHAT